MKRDEAAISGLAAGRSRPLTEEAFENRPAHTAEMAEDDGPDKYQQDYPKKHREDGRDLSLFLFCII